MLRDRISKLLLARAPAWQPCSLSLKLVPQHGPHLPLHPKLNKGSCPKGWTLNSLGVRGDGGGAGGFLYLVLQLHDLVVLPVQLHVLVLHDFEELLDVTVLLLHKSLAQGGKDGGGLRSSTRSSAVVLPL